MSLEKKLEMLRKLSEVAKLRALVPYTDKDWEEEQKAVDKIRKENKDIQDSIRMSYETFHRKFDL